MTCSPRPGGGCSSGACAALVQSAQRRRLVLPGCCFIRLYYLYYETRINPPGYDLINMNMHLIINTNKEIRI